MEWIDVNKRLPEFREDVLAVVDDGGQHQHIIVTSLETILTNSSGTQYVWEDIRNDNFEVTHWAKLPEMPITK